MRIETFMAMGLRKGQPFELEGEGYGPLGVYYHSLPVGRNIRSPQVRFVYDLADISGKRTDGYALGLISRAEPLVMGEKVTDFDKLKLRKGQIAEFREKSGRQYLRFFACFFDKHIHLATSRVHIRKDVSILPIELNTFEWIRPGVC